MRHLGSLLIGLVVAPIGWLLFAIGQGKSTDLFAKWTSQNKFDTTALIAPVGYLAAAGILVGLLACLRMSPVGPLLVSLIYLGLYGAFLVDPILVLERIPEHLDLKVVMATPRVPAVNGTLAVIGVCLLVAAVNPDRWRRQGAAAAAATGAGASSFDSASSFDTASSYDSASSYGDAGSYGGTSSYSGLGDLSSYSTGTGDSLGSSDSTPGMGALLMATDPDSSGQSKYDSDPLTSTDQSSPGKFSLRRKSGRHSDGDGDDSGRHSSPWSDGLDSLDDEF